MSRYTIIKGQSKQGYLSVTELIGQYNKPYLVDWAFKEACRIATENNGASNISEIMWRDFKSMREDTLDVGSRIHSHIEKYIQCKIIGIDFKHEEVTGDREKYGFSKFLYFERENVSEWLLSEYVVYNEDLCIAGRLDAVYRDKQGKIVLCDFKSSNDIYKENEVQVFTYAYLFNLMENGRFEVIFKENKTNEKTFWQDHKKLKIDKAQIVLVGKDESEIKIKDIVLGSDVSKRYEVVMKSLVNMYYYLSERRMSNKMVDEVADIGNFFKKKS